jgi:hypothetical protein
LFSRMRDRFFNTRKAHAPTTECNAEFPHAPVIFHSPNPWLTPS